MAKIMCMWIRKKTKFKKHKKFRKHCSNNNSTFGRLIDKKYCKIIIPFWKQNSTFVMRNNIFQDLKVVLDDLRVERDGTMLLRNRLWQCQFFGPNFGTSQLRAKLKICWRKYLQQNLYLFSTYITLLAPSPFIWTRVCS